MVNIPAGCRHETGGRQGQQQLQPGRQHGHDRSADGIGKREGGDQLTRGGQAHIKVSRQGGQQAGDHEALGADGERAEGQPYEWGQRSSHGDVSSETARLLFGIGKGIPRSDRRRWEPRSRERSVHRRRSSRRRRWCEACAQSPAKKALMKSPLKCLRGYLATICSRRSDGN